MCLENKVLEKTTCNEYLSLDEKLEIARQRSKESKSTSTTEPDDFLKEMEK